MMGQTFWRLVFHCSERLYLSINWPILNLCQFPNSFCFMRIFWVKSLLDKIQSFCVSIPCFPLKSIYIYIFDGTPRKCNRSLDFPQQIAALQPILIFKDVFEDRVNISISNAVHHSNHSAWKILAVKHSVLHFSHGFPIHSPRFSHLFPWISHSYFIPHDFPHFPRFPQFQGYIFPKVLPMSFSHCSKALSSTRSWPPRPCPPAPAPPQAPKPRRGCGAPSRWRSGDGRRRGDAVGSWTWGSSEEWSNGKWMVY